MGNARPAVAPTALEPAKSLLDLIVGHQAPWRALHEAHDPPRHHVQGWQLPLSAACERLASEQLAALREAVAALDAAGPLGPAAAACGAVRRLAEHQARLLCQACPVRRAAATETGDVHPLHQLRAGLNATAFDGQDAWRLRRELARLRADAESDTQPLGPPAPISTAPPPPPPRSRLAVSPEKGGAFLDGVGYPLAEEPACWLAAIVAGKGAVVSVSEAKKTYPVLENWRADRLRAGLPEALDLAIEAVGRKGYRVRAEYL